MLTRFLAALLLLTAATPGAAQRLSGDVAPERYDLWFAPDFESDTFRGRTTIDVTLRVPADAITMRAAELIFDAVTIEAGGTVQVASITVDADAETATLHVPARLDAGAATIRSPIPASSTTDCAGST